jgi:glycosyltransferase involved in cell wall biosynthesis
MKKSIQVIVEIILIPFILYKAIVNRYRHKSIDIGLGPQALINNIYHKKALEIYGYSVETFVSNPFYITNDFDIVISDKYNIKTVIGQFFSFLYLIKLAFKYKILYFYFNGGPLGVSTRFIWRFEAFFYSIAKVKTVVMPYGSDIQDLGRSKNLYFKHVVNIDYPNHKNNRKTIEIKIDYWTNNATHVISGCEWVDYMCGWDTLMIAHFSISCLTHNKIVKNINKKEVFKIFHAPNHKAIKGSQHLMSAVKELNDKEYNIELIMLSGVSNQEVLEAISKVDLVADQFVIGWYAMFAIEAMSLGKPVLCYLREDLVELYIKSDLLNKGEIPIINTDILNIKEKIIWAYNNRIKLAEIGRSSKEYVKKHHSLEYIGGVFDKINKQVMEIK